MELCLHSQSLPPALQRLVIAAVSVEAFIRCHSDHDHDHDNVEEACSVCVQLAIAQHILGSLVSIALALSVLFAEGVKKLAAIQFFCFPSPRTLISLKVQFNN
jgi:hypothetical protein